LAACASCTASAVVSEAMPGTTGTRAPTASTRVSMIASFSS
jgi:hypothetical protein